MSQKLSHLTKSCDAVFSTSAVKRSLVGLVGLTLTGFISGAVLFHDVSGPPEKLTGISLSHIDIKERIIEEPIHKIAPPPVKVAEAVKETTTPVEPSPPINVKPDAEAGLYEVTSYGSLPIIRERDKMTPFKAYQGTFVAKPTTKGLIAIVMVDFGLSDISAKEATLNLPSGISFVASPYAGNLQEKITNARSYGHEVWMHIPVEGANFGNDDSGPVTLLTGLKKENNILRLKSILGRATGYSGVIMMESPNFSASPENLDAIFGELAQRGLGYAQADNNDTATTTLAASLNIPHARATMWLDASHDKADFKANFQKLEELALSNKVAIGFVHTSPALFPLLNNWATSLADKNIELAPLTFTTRTTEVAQPPK